jgi:hypothetical protein
MAGKCSASRLNGSLGERRDEKVAKAIGVPDGCVFGDPPRVPPRRADAFVGLGQRRRVGLLTLELRVQPPSRLDARRRRQFPMPLGLLGAAVVPGKQ